MSRCCSCLQCKCSYLLYFIVLSQPCIGGAGQPAALSPSDSILCPREYLGTSGTQPRNNILQQVQEAGVAFSTALDLYMQAEPNPQHCQKHNLSPQTSPGLPLEIGTHLIDIVLSICIAIVRAPVGLSVP